MLRYLTVAFAALYFSATISLMLLVISPLQTVIAKQNVFFNQDASGNGVLYCGWAWE